MMPPSICAGNCQSCKSPAEKPSSPVKTTGEPVSAKANKTTNNPAALTGVAGTHLNSSNATRLTDAQ
jgi:hypothetical protein